VPLPTPTPSTLPSKSNIVATPLEPSARLLGFHLVGRRSSRRSVCCVHHASIQRRRSLAASGPMPATLACRFTTGELAVLRIVADAVRDNGQCVKSIPEIAARAGVCRTTAQNAIRQARPWQARERDPAFLLRGGAAATTFRLPDRFFRSSPMLFRFLRDHATIAQAVNRPGRSSSQD
jgi:hypothetical protein